MEGRMMPGLSLDEILAILPHRYPFLLVDRIIEVEERRVVGIKNVTINEPFFPGHIPGFPVMPGVLVAEAMGRGGRRRPGPGEPLVCWPARAGCPKCWRAPCAPGAAASSASRSWGRILRWRPSPTSLPA